MVTLNLKDLESAIREISSEEDLRPYKELGNGLYELPGNVITNKNGLEEYLKQLTKEFVICT